MICEICGHKFKPEHGHQKYCSKTCQEQAQKQKSHNWYILNYKKQTKQKSTCSYCGKQFTKQHGNQKYCSKTCKENMMREQNSRASMKYYYKRRKTRGGDKAWGLGSGGLGAHMNNDWTIEYKKIENEMKRLRLTF